MALEEEGDGGQVKSLRGPRERQRRGWGARTLGPVDVVEAAPAQPQREARPLLRVLPAERHVAPHTSRVQAIFHLPPSAPIYVRQRLTRGQV